MSKSGGVVVNPRRNNIDVCKSTSVEKYEKKPMKRKRRHTTDMEDLLAEDEERLASIAAGDLSLQMMSKNSQNGKNNSLEDQSEMLNRQFSKLEVKEKHRKSKRHCTRFVIYLNCLLVTTRRPFHCIEALDYLH